jgi:exonuclease SbcC
MTLRAMSTNPCSLHREPEPMRLIRLAMLNFRQHANTEIEFRSGLTGIIGPNGAGKSTILEAIAWAVYGSAAARGTNDTIRFSRAPGRSRVQVELTFELGGNEYRAVRSLNNAEVYVDGGASPVASGLGAATDFLQARLSMTREEFFNTYFTGQKELQFLAQMGATQRGRFLGQVLGYERLRVAQDRARARRNELKHEIDGLRTALPDPAALAADTRAAQKRRSQTLGSLEKAESDRKKSEARLAKLTPAWDAACAAKDETRVIDNEITVVRVERAAAQQEMQRLATDLKAIAEAEKELEPLRRQLEALPALDEQCRQLARVAAQAQQRRLLEQSEKTLAGELAEITKRLATLRDAPLLAEQFRAELKELQQQLDEVEALASRLQDEWVAKRNEIETRLIQYREHAQELKEQLAQLREAGPDGTCPTCKQPLGKNFESVVGTLQDEWDKLVQDGKWLRQRGEQLSEKPPELSKAETGRDALRRATTERAQKIARCEAAAHELQTLLDQQGRKDKQLTDVRAQLADVQVEYDMLAHKRADERLKQLRDLERRAARLEQTAEARGARDEQAARARAREDEVQGRLAALEARRAAMKFSDAEFEKLRKQHEALRDDLRRLELNATELKGVYNAAETALDGAIAAEASYRELAARLEDLELDQRHHGELDTAFTRLRGELNARVRPELGELASGFLTDITDGRYTSLEIDENYNVLVLDEGEEKPVISGGEEDVANLVLRLAISQMIADRAGQPLSILILDEVFGSLDVERRDNVVQLLHRLEDRFEQVILITHIDTIREGLDNVIRVEFDERTGASVVREESPVERVEELVY